jgi:hypothetical protein
VALQWSQLADAQSRCLSQLGLQRRAAKLTSLQEYLEQRKAETKEPHGDPARGEDPTPPDATPGGAHRGGRERQSLNSEPDGPASGGTTGRTVSSQPAYLVTHPQPPPLPDGGVGGETESSA